MSGAHVGYAAMLEQFGPSEVTGYTVAAEQAGFTGHDRVGDARQPGSDDRTSRTHRLQHRDRQAILVARGSGYGWKHRDGRCSVLGGQLPAPERTEEDHR